jgi:hypothetical protein
MCESSSLCNHSDSLRRGFSHSGCDGPIKWKFDEISRSLAVRFSAMSTSATGRGCVKTLPALTLPK